MTPHVVVIGGGIAGLAAAHRLVGAGADVELIEADDRLGGKLRTSPFAGRMVDEGADAFLLRVPWALDLCTALGIDDELVHPAARTAYILSGGALRPLPPQFMGVPTDLDALAASGLVSDDGLRRARSELELAASPPSGDETIGAVIERRLGREVLERLVDPLIGGINAGDTRRQSLAAVVPQLDAAARDPEHPSLIAACRARLPESSADPPPLFASPVSGMGRMVAALASSLGGAQVRLGRRVEAVETASTGATVVLDDGIHLSVDAVIVAVPAYALAQLLVALVPEETGALDQVEHASVAIVTFAFRPDDLGRPLDRSGFLVPRVEPTKALTACSWSSTKWAHLDADHGDGTVVLRASAGRHGDQVAIELDDDTLVSHVLDDLTASMGGVGAPTEVRISRWPQSFPQYAPGHLARVAALERALPPTVAVAGAALRGVGVPACIASGQAAADRVLATIAPVAGAAR